MRSMNAERITEFKTKLGLLLQEYGLCIYGEQVSGDDQGVEVGVCISQTSFPWTDVCQSNEIDSNYLLDRNI